MKLMHLLVAVTLVAGASFAQTARLGDLKPSSLVVTNASSSAELAAHTNRTDNPHAVTAAQVGAVSNTPAGIAAAGGFTGAVYAAQSGPTWAGGVLTIGTNGFGGGGGSVPAGTLTNGNLTIGYSNNMLYFNIPLATCTGIVFNVGGTNILLKQNN